MILVVDDDPSFLEQARAILNRERHVFLASNAIQAFKLAQSLGFSVALVDLDLPGDGFALIRKMHEAVPDLPIVAISSAFQGRPPERPEEFGIVEILKKPITPAWKPVVERIRARRARR
jgi:CheY-like chemotaxis protein